MMKLESGLWSFRSTSTASSVPSVLAAPRSAPQRGPSRSCNPSASSSACTLPQTRAASRFPSRVRRARTRWRDAEMLRRESSDRSRKVQSTIARPRSELRTPQRIARKVSPNSPARPTENRADHLDEAIRLPLNPPLPFSSQGTRDGRRHFLTNKSVARNEGRFLHSKSSTRAPLVRLLLHIRYGFGQLVQ